MAITGNQVRAARSLVGMGQQELADAAKIGINTVRNMEGVGADRIRVRTDTLDAVTDALKAAGVLFVDEGDMIPGGPGVRLATKLVAVGPMGDAGMQTSEKAG